MILYSIERKLVAADTPVAPPERPVRSQVASVLPSLPTVSSSRTRVDREPQITSVKATAPGDDGDGRSDERSDSSVESSDGHKSGSEFTSDRGGDSDSSGPLGSTELPVRIGPPVRTGAPRHVGMTENVSKEVFVPDGDVGDIGPPVHIDTPRHVGMTGNISGDVVVPDGEVEDVPDEDVIMHSPPHVPHHASQRGRTRNIKAIGSFHHSQPAKSSGASRTYGGVIRGRALGNVPNVGDFGSTDVNSQFIDVEGTVNLFPSNTHPTTMDIDETALIAVTIPFEEALAPLLQQVAKYYSPLLDNNLRVYILDPKKRKWIVKGRFKDAIEFEDSVFQFWDQTKFGPNLTIFLENDPEVASAIPPSFHSHRSRSSSLLKSESTSHSSSALRRHSGSRSVARPSLAPTPFKGPSTLTDLHKEALLTFLRIPTELPSLSDTLRNNYKKYLACVDASQAFKGLRLNEKWADHLEEFGLEPWVPIYIDLLNIFISKTQFYSTWQILFRRVQKFPQMIEWLEKKEDDGSSDSEIWAEKKRPDFYTLADLTDWMDKKDVVKGKKPAVAARSSEKKLKKKKERKVSSEEESSPERQKSKSKSKKKLSE